MREARFTPASMHVLADIYEYIKAEIETAALKTLKVLFQQAELLAETPWVGRNRAGDIGEGVRSYPVGSYVLFYRVLDDAVEVLRVFHGARDLPPLFE